MRIATIRKAFRWASAAWLTLAIVALMLGLPVLWWPLYLFDGGWFGLAGSVVYLSANVILAYKAWNEAQADVAASARYLAIDVLGLSIPATYATWIHHLLYGGHESTAAVVSAFVAAPIILAGIVVLALARDLEEALAKKAPSTTP
jgi:hypothetical protein